MTLDITRPEHRDALRWAAETKAQAPSVVHYWSLGDDLAGGLRQVAIRALSSPEQSAALVRALLEGCGVRVCGYGCDAGDVRVYRVPGYGPCGNHTFDRVGVWIVGDAYPLGPLECGLDVTALILRLLACTTHEEALAALREAGR